MVDLKTRNFQKTISFPGKARKVYYISKQTSDFSKK